MNGQVVRFFSKLLLFVIPLGLFLWYVERGLSRMPNTYSTKRANLERQLNDIGVIVLGDSWAATGVDPAFFRINGFNLASGGQSLWYDVGLVRKYIDRLPRLRGIVMGLSYLSLGYTLEDSIEKWREAFYDRFWGLAPRRGSIGSWDTRLQYTLIRLYDKERVMRAILTNFEQDFNSAGENGWVASTSSGETIDDRSGRTRATVHNNMMSEANYTVNSRLLEDFMAEMDARGVQVAFVTPPASRTYYAYVDPDNRERNERLLGELCVRYRCRYLDYLEDPRFSREDFYNNDHLNRHGAEKFSRILDRDVVAAMNGAGG